MDIKDLDKKQLILLTLLITFVVSVATGIVTVSLMKEMPKTVPQTIERVIQRTIEKVSTDSEEKGNTEVSIPVESNYFGDNLVISIYKNDAKILLNDLSSLENDKPLGEGIIFSDEGLILVENNILGEADIYKIILDKKEFDAKILKKFSNGFVVLQIFEKKEVQKPTESTTPTTPVVDNVQ